MQSCGFFVASDRGYWNGTEWLARPEEALRFARAECGDPWRACEDVCQELMRNVGVACIPLYISFRAAKAARKSTSRRRVSGVAPAQTPSVKA